MLYRPPHRRREECRCRVDHPIYEDGAGHVRTLDDPAGPSTPLLGGVRQFCAAFWHIEPTTEAGLTERCLHAARGGTACARKTVVCVSRLQERTPAPSGAGSSAGSDSPHRWRDLYTARYANCHREGAQNTHAERFMVGDAALAAVLARVVAPIRLIMYLTYQPCHYSGGHTREVRSPAREISSSGPEMRAPNPSRSARDRAVTYPQAMDSSTSCTRLLLRYASTELRPRGATLHIRVPYLYRAHWQVVAN